MGMNIGINGLITSSMSYAVPAGEEVLTVATNRTAPPQARHASGEDEILGHKEFALLKRGVFLCNAARGQSINEPALLQVLDNGRISGAWLDSFFLNHTMVRYAANQG